MKKNLFLFIISLCLLTQADPIKVGCWEFEKADSLNKATIGNNLISVNPDGLYTTEGPASDNNAVWKEVGSYYKVNHGIAANGGGKNVNQYTLMIDFQATSIDGYQSFLQTDPLNGGKNDGDFFIYDGTIGVGELDYSSYKIKKNDWYRLVISVDLANNSLKCYIDGKLILDGVPNISPIIDGRFSLATNNNFLLFADNDGEEGEFGIAEVALWNGALNAEQVASLGGYGHDTKIQYDVSLLKPYLQTPTSNSVYISWHDSLKTKTEVQYGLTSALGQSKLGTFETIEAPFVWQTVKLTDLTPNTKYYYKVISGSGESSVYMFNTLPEKGSDNHIRFLLISDTHSGDISKTEAILDSAKKQLTKLYGVNYKDSLNFFMHTGDIVDDGNNIQLYNDAFFNPISFLSSSLPFMVTIGNHENESPYFYKYMKYEDISGIQSEPYNEKFWKFRANRSLFIGLNANDSKWNTQQKTWLDTTLQRVESDAGIDFVFCFIHRCPFTELWEEEGSDEYAEYINNNLLATMQKYSKVQQLSYGHSHGFERGAVKSLAANTNGDITIACVGGGGGYRDYWYEDKNVTPHDYPEVNIALEDYFFVLADVDTKNKSYEFKTYSIGNAYRELPLTLVDSWHHKANQVKPEKPLCVSSNLKNDTITFLSSTFVGVDSLMSTQIQISGTSGGFSSTLKDVTRDWRDIFALDNLNDRNPIDRSKGLNLINYKIAAKSLTSKSQYFWRVRYRDQNLKWSDWSDEGSIAITAIEDNNSNLSKEITVNNPMSDNLVIKCDDNVVIDNVKIYDAQGKLMLNKDANNERSFDVSSLSNGFYILKIKTDRKDYYLKVVK